ncbi:hypothetical protein M885DRAFT_624870 [Pelagophyceae sp. CCMP2097]|nr:hypothetical protein M885DRAFT_624870 [Pelagophyceae sp. CCMP2097]
MDGGNTDGGNVDGGNASDGARLRVGGADGADDDESAHAAGYAGAADLASDLLDKKNGGVIKKNDVSKDVSGNMNPAGHVIVARLKTHLEVVYSGDAGKTRMPTGFIELLIKAEVKAQLPPPPGAL